MDFVVSFFFGYDLQYSNIEFILLNPKTLEGEKGNRILTENLGYSFRENREMKKIDHSHCFYDITF